MDIKIGFTHSTRELVIKAADAGEASTLEEKIIKALDSGDKTLTFSDEKGRTYVVRAETVAYIELGAEERRSVGFMGA